MNRKSGTLEERFWERVEKSDGCWEWQAYCCNQTGYGRIYGRGKKWNTHRLSWVLHFGPVPEGMVVRHKCDNRKCVNPGHLELGDQADNVRDMWERGRARCSTEAAVAALRGKRDPLCKRGHTKRVRGNGQLYCLTCQTEAAKAKQTK